MAADIVFNAKTSRPSVCNAMETLLIHEKIAGKALPVIKNRLDEKNVELRGCARTREILGDTVKPATEEDYATEFLDYILAVRVVKDLDEALAHIARYSSGHSECIVTESYENARRFEREVDAAARLCQCLYPVHRRRHVRLRGGNRYFHPEAPRPGPHGCGTADQHEIRHPRRRADSRIRYADGPNR